MIALKGREKQSSIERKRTRVGYREGEREGEKKS